MRYLIVFMLGLWHAGCTPVTLDNDPPIDFDRYSSVYVAPLTGEGYDDDRRFLVHELRADSGFKLVTMDPEVNVTAVLLVQVEITDVDEDADGDLDINAVALFRLEDAYTGALIDRGQVNDDAPQFASAVREALDDVVLRYLKAYRI